ncbi:Uncharacterised protein [Alcaligenes faecalis]|nr:hypothetical protein [Alcaligenes faecalis]MCX5593052.1 hypothetical protein [Alcaligenes faecalis]GAU72432.1 hypothetical protein AFA2_00744 [Alcaligenes faecalis subsp. faecalis NBRC 13111]CUI53209.1 Uncharacterised protein [Alcaligenes faecalis]
MICTVSDFIPTGEMDGDAIAAENSLALEELAAGQNLVEVLGDKAP